MKDTIVIDVLQEDIDKAISIRDTGIGLSSSCPIALALTRVAKAPASWGYTGGAVNDDTGVYSYACKTPADEDLAYDLVYHFDQRLYNDIGPITFTVEEVDHDH